ncbi:MAG: hypothetical protein EZS28_041194 [Streblomastix strix]|uniref:Uncharacterized protein n=1 Tax=Streblomastix strix TaxID=222440 RepID=A0A5J4TZ79_9EUKA|nr:MAG: hypothetical protein EZS28_041194 [Streblomastix strix]
MFDPQRRQYVPAFIQRDSMSSQYMLEGFTAGALFMIGGLSFYLMTNKSVISVLSGLGIFVFTYLLSSLFMRQKIEGYPY